ncbi:MAG: nucleotidyltransferase domain-containing protein [Nanoarchaeota archaeon]|nr:nucleotidyltransferase domain-containing protein [Nanoarchaeota archaeon]
MNQETENHKEKKEETKSVEQNLSENYVPKSKLGDLPISNNLNSDDLKKQMDKTKQNIEKFKKEITKKFKFLDAIGIIPPQASKIIEEEYEIPEEASKKKLMHILVIVPEEKFKEIGKIKLEAINLAKQIDDKLWVHVLTPYDVWGLCMDSKFEIAEAFSMSYPILDKGILGALRVAQIHKTLVLKKFEKYVTSYVIAGSLVRGTTHKDSDVDVFIIIDDTDVKKMSRLELKEKLRAIIFSYIQEATAIAGVKNILNVQTYLMTEFWEAVKDAHPVMFTFIRDGVALYDRGAFLPWKSLLRMGKIKPSPEAIDMFMSSGDKLEEMIDRRLMDIMSGEIYWSVLTPSQGLLMLYGLAPPTPKETVKLMREVFFEKEKLLEKKYIDIFEGIVSFYKDYEHGKIKKISGVELDKFVKEALDYMKRLKELRKQIEKRVQEKSIQQVYEDVFGMLESILKKKNENAIINEFNEQFIKPGKFPKRFLEGLKFIARVKKEFEKPEKNKKKNKKDKITGKEIKEVETARRFSAEIVNLLIEYTQRCDFLSMDRTRFILKSKDRAAEIFFLDDLFIVEKGKISKVKENELKESDTEELKKQLLEHKNKETKMDAKSLNSLKRVFGDFELVY